MTAEQEDLRDAVRGLLAAAGAERSAWPRLCREVGVAGLAIPEHYGLHLFGRPARHAAAIAASLIDR